MDSIASSDIQRRIARDNPWWEATEHFVPEANHPRRVYFRSFKELALNFDIRRATVLLGPRRVGKTFMIKQLIHEAISGELERRNVLYVSIDTPIYSGISLEKFLDFMPEFDPQKRYLVIFDEIQYLKSWEIHLKDLVDNFPNVKFVASGSAAAALKLSSKESGAGRFSDFMLPPLTFYEFLLFLGEDNKYVRWTTNEKGKASCEALDIDGLNARFIDYLNYGGYPEAVVNEQIRANPDQFIKNDIIDKVLLKDLPSLYGIASIQELNKLFSFLAYNAGMEASLENISQASGVTKPTIKKYIEYLESAFLIIKITNVDDNCRSMKRERNFKVYLNNPSMRAALFAPVDASDTARIGLLAESAIFSQWQHSSGFKQLHYARWRNEGEVDIVYLGGNERPLWAVEVKWSDRIESKFNEETASLASLLRKNKTINSVLFTTKTKGFEGELEGRPLDVRPSSLHCYQVGRNITSRVDEKIKL